MNENQPAKPRKKRLIVLIVVAALVVLAVAAYFIARTVAHSFIQSEISTRSDWEIDTGDVADREAAQQVTVYTDPVEATIEITQIVPDEYEDEGFTYYDEEVQDRLASTLLGLTQEGNYTMGSPLAILNPFGTGSNGLYLYFGTSNPTQVQYTVSVEDDAIPDYTAWANNAGEDGYSRVQEFLLIGLVPGMENTVTLTAYNRQGQEAQSATFTIDMPEATSGYDVTLETVDGDSTQALSNGLYYAMGIGGQYGYTFFYDNDGVMRYEMVLEGYHSDRFLWDDDGSLITCVGSTKVARLNRFGQVTQVFDLGQYELHHDINWGPEGTILALATDLEGETVEDQVLQIDLEARSPTLWTSPRCSKAISTSPARCRPPTPSACGARASGTGSISTPSSMTRATTPSSSAPGRLPPSSSAPWGRSPPSCGWPATPISGRAPTLPSTAWRPRGTSTTSTASTTWS